MDKHVFYSIDDLSIEERTNIINDAFSKKTKWWVDVNLNITKEKINMSFEDIMKKFDNSCHFVVINRYDVMNYEHYGEIGFSTIAGKEYVLWIYITDKDLDDIVKKYNLKIWE